MTARGFGRRAAAALASMTILARVAVAWGQDWGTGAANAKLMPNNIFAPAATPAAVIAHLAYFVLGITGAIFLVVAGLLTYAIIRYRRRAGDDGREPPQVYGSNPIELAWTTLPVLIVFVLILITGRTIYTVQAAARPADALQVRVIGHQWWWEFRYPSLGIVTANELHVPVSDPAHPRPTFLTLESADVAHSFWVPRLAGKTDVIPNRRNQMWLDPHRAGIYLGQCGEFCGSEHALMLIRVVAQPPAQFAQWVAAQQRPATRDPGVAAGRDLFLHTACVNCHTVRGTLAAGRFGPDLTHLMSRATLGAGAALNSPAHLKVWVDDPATIKPDVLMPAMNLSPADLNQVVAYLASLR